MQKSNQTVPSLTYNGLSCANWFKYYSQFNNKHIDRPLPYERITAKTLYQSDVKKFDLLASICNKYDIDVKKYMKFMALTKKTDRKSIASKSLDISYIREFIESELIRVMRTKIFNTLVKTAERIADECIKLGYFTTKDYLRMLISQRKLSSYYVSGLISKHYLAALPKFPKIVEKLDSISRDEFLLICHKYEKYHIDILEAMVLERSRVFSVLEFTDSLILKKRELKNHV